MEELWKDIKEIPGLECFEKFQVSNIGRVRSFKVCPQGAILKTSLRKGNSLTYEVLSLIDSKGTKKRFSIHRLVCLAFNYIDGCEQLTVDHIDENPLNNRADNLQWLSIAENIRKSQKKSKLFSKEEIEEIVKEYSVKGVRLKDLAQKYQCSLWTIWNLVNNYSSKENLKKRKTIPACTRVKIGKAYISGFTLKEIGEKFNISVSSASFIVNQYLRGEFDDLT